MKKKKKKSNAAQHMVFVAYYRRKGMNLTHRRRGTGKSSEKGKPFSLEFSPLPAHISKHNGPKLLLLFGEQNIKKFTPKWPSLALKY